MGIVATIGFFDGVHRGHQSVLHRLIDTAKKCNSQSMVITFASHPQSDMLLLNSLQERQQHIYGCGVDYIEVLDFKSIRQMTAQQFMHDKLREQLHVDTLLMGYDHRFGSDQITDFRVYQAIGQKEGINIIALPQYAPEGKHVSSSVIRNLISQGDVDMANQLLGYSYTIEGSVVEGRQIGRTIGFPTANVQIPTDSKLMPAVGVYVVDIENDQWEGKKRGMLNIGSNPTIGDNDNTIEVNVFDFDGNLYGSKIVIHLLHRLRGEILFPSILMLQKQLERDKDNSMKWQGQNKL